MTSYLRELYANRKDPSMGLLRSIRRRWFGIPVLIWLIPGTALAVVGLVALLGTSGSISSAEASDVYYVDAPSPSYEGTVISGNPTCDVDYVSESEISITADDATPGAKCEFRVRVGNDGPSQAVLNGFTLSSTDFVGGEVTASVAECGQLVEVNGGSAAHVVFDLSFGDVQPGQTFAFDASTDGLDWRVPASYVEAECG